MDAPAFDDQLLTDLARVFAEAALARLLAKSEAAGTTTPAVVDAHQEAQASPAT